jgi:F-type H+-transporting ATPase subunit b
MAHKRKLLLILLLLPLLVFMTTEEESHSSPLRDFLGKTVNFLILFGGLAYLLRKPVKNFLQRRSQDIENSLRNAKSAKKEAEQKLKDAEIRLSGLKDEIEKIKEDARSEGRRKKEEMAKLTRQEADKVKNFAKQEIEMLLQAGIQELKEHTTELAVAVAEERIKKRITSEDMSVLIDKSIGRLDKLYEKSNFDKKIHSRTG